MSCSLDHHLACTQDDRIDVQVVATKSSLAFYTPEQVAKASQGRVRVWTDEDEWGASGRTHEASGLGRPS